MPIEEMKVFLDRAKAGGRKSFRFEELNPSHFLEKQSGVLVPYLEMIAKELEEEENSKNS